MRVDMHVHGALSKQTGFDLDELREKTAFAHERGIGAIILTEHFNISGFEKIYDLLLTHFPFTGDYYVIEKVRVFPGIEVNVAEGPHLIAAGTLERILKLHECLQGCREKDKFCSAEMYFSKQVGMNLLNIFAHPTRIKHQLHQLTEQYYQYFDAFEVNAKDLYLYGRSIIDEIKVAADKAGVQVVAGSDTHHPFQLGAVYNDFIKAPESVDDMKIAIASGQFELRIDAEAEARVESAIKAKRISKAALLNLPLDEITDEKIDVSNKS